MNISAPAFRKICLGGILAVLAGISIHHQIVFSIKPLVLSAPQIPSGLLRDDMQKLSAAAPDLAAVIHTVRTFPPGTRFYFAPCFSDSGNSGRWWWYVCLITRYFAHPRSVFAHDKVQYDAVKETYLMRFIGQAKTWQEVDWIRNRKIGIIILMRHNAIEFIRADQPIGGL